jgi:glucose-1-phosphate cytidylyltransferase
MTQVVILCGGKGTRLKELTEEIPKPLIEIGGKPILWHIMKIYSHYGFNDFILCLGYKGEKIKEYFKDHHNSWNIQYIETGEDSLKSERLKQVKPLIKDENFLLAYGDDVSDVNLKEVFNFHLKNKKIATITACPLYSQFGILEINEKDEITEFKEKPRIENLWFNGGFMVLNKDIFNYLDKGELEKEVFSFLSKEKQIQAFKHNGFWKSMNTFKETKELNDLWDSNKAFWKVW